MVDFARRLREAEKGNGYPLEWEEQQLGSGAFVAHVAGHPGGGAESCVWCLGEDGLPEGVDSPLAVGVGGSPQGEGSRTKVAQKGGEVNLATGAGVDLGEWDLLADPPPAPPGGSYQPHYAKDRPKAAELGGRPAVIYLPRWLMAEKGLASPKLEGVVIRETAKAVLFSGSALMRPSTLCHRCGLEITNPVSQLVGYGPVCSEYLGIPRDVGKGELERFKEKAAEMTKWEGWLPKSRVEVWYDEKS